MPGNYLKRRALMRWSSSILNDDTKCLVRWVNNRNTEAGKTKTKVIQKASKGHQISTKTCQGLPKWCLGAKVQILYRFWLDFGNNFGSIFNQKIQIKCSTNCLRKSMQEKCKNLMIKPWKSHTEIVLKVDEKSYEIQTVRFLWFCKESNVFLSS